jgi:beta-glucosidase
MSQSFITGEWPPQGKSKFTAYKVYKNLMETHRRVYRLAKQIRPDIQIGIAQSMFCSKPARPGNIIDRIAAAIPRWIWNYWFVDRTRRSLDFIGVNFYMTDYRRGFKSANPPGPVNDMGWYMEPGALQTVLEQTYHRYKLPLIVSENGLADAKDAHREWWIRESIAAVGKARASDVKIFGYLHWSLLDNFEWAHGWWPKFGLIAVDRSKPGMPRTIRKSASTLAKEYTRVSEKSS